MLNFYNQEMFLSNGRIQEIIWVEELSELQKEITKSLRGKLRKDCMEEELADVLICLEQLKIKYNISDDELQKWIDYKNNRNVKRQEEKERKEKRIIMNPKYDDAKDMFK